MIPRCINCGVVIFRQQWKDGIRTCDKCSTQMKLDGERL